MHLIVIRMIKMKTEEEEEEQRLKYKNENALDLYLFLLRHFFVDLVAFRARKRIACRRITGGDIQTARTTRTGSHMFSSTVFFLFIWVLSSPLAIILCVSATVFNSVIMRMCPSCFYSSIFKLIRFFSSFFFLSNISCYSLALVLK